MKLYKDGKCMQNVDKDQLEICLDAGWSRTEPTKEVEAPKEVEKVEAPEKVEVPEAIAPKKGGRILKSKNTK